MSVFWRKVVCIPEVACLYSRGRSLYSRGLYSRGWLFVFQMLVLFIPEVGQCNPEFWVSIEVDCLFSQAGLGYTIDRPSILHLLTAKQFTAFSFTFLYKVLVPTRNSSTNQSRIGPDKD